jgi:NhaP-type Na+/H+ or K+/H+ antiporter
VAEFRQVGWPLVLLLTVGAAVTWCLTAVLARLIVGLSWPTAVLLGALLVVTGPTVIGPLLRQIRPVGAVGPLLRWEGIIIDPIGAVLALLVFEVTQAAPAAGVESALWQAIRHLGLTLACGGVIGAVGAYALGLLLRRHAVADHLEAPVALALVLAGFVISNHVQPESGLLTVTVMGLVLANLKGVPLRHVLEFKENLSVLLISCLFILLSARLSRAQLSAVGWSGLAFVATLILVVRPASVFAATLRSGLNLREKVFLSWVAPRGIVAASVAAVFALRMGESGRLLVPLVFAVIAGTVLVYGLTAFPLARRLGLATADPQGLLIAGANPLARSIAEILQQQGFRVLLVDTNHANVRAARLAGLPAQTADVLADQDVETLDFGGLGRFLAMTPNEEVNALAALNLADVFGRSHVYQLTPARVAQAGETAGAHQRARLLFTSEATYSALSARLQAGDRLKATPLTQEFGLKAFRDRYGASALPLFACQGGKMSVLTAGEAPSARPGQTLIALVPQGPASAEADT